MNEMIKVSSGNYVSMKKLYDAYEANDGRFGCKLTLLRLERISKVFDKWKVEVSYSYSKESNKNKFDYEVDMTYDFLWNRTHALLYYLGR